jgi:hypothetical protein
VRWSRASCEKEIGGFGELAEALMCLVTSCAPEVILMRRYEKICTISEPDTVIKFFLTLLLRVLQKN